MCRVSSYLRVSCCLDTAFLCPWVIAVYSPIGATIGRLVPRLAPTPFLGLQLIDLDELKRGRKAFTSAKPKPVIAGETVFTGN